VGGRKGGREGGRERTEVIVLAHHIVVLDLKHDGLVLSVHLELELLVPFRVEIGADHLGREGGREGQSVSIHEYSCLVSYAPLSFARSLPSLHSCHTSGSRRSGS